jgi:hypothetical protein
MDHLDTHEDEIIEKIHENDVHWQKQILTELGR